jgi:hypothetical protein
MANTAAQMAAFIFQVLSGSTALGLSNSHAREVRGSCSPSRQRKVYYAPRPFSWDYHDPSLRIIREREEGSGDGKRTAVARAPSRRRIGGYRRW